MFGLNKIIPVDSDYKFLNFRKNFYIISGIAIFLSLILLFVFGSGPIKGFSITLSLGVIASMFTALMLTNLLVHFYVSFTSKKEINL